MPTIEVRLPCSLKELYNGCMKTISYERQAVALDGKTVNNIICNKTIEVKPGSDPINNYTFKGEGH
jgi:DnaJ family protein B protein 13